MSRKEAKMEDLVGLTIKTWELNEDATELRVTTADGRMFLWAHNQDCCEDVRIESVAGEVKDLFKRPLLVSELTQQKYDLGLCEHQTWSFYRFATDYGWVIVRWLGTSNGYYSEEVSMYEVKE